MDIFFSCTCKWSKTLHREQLKLLLKNWYQSNCFVFWKVAHTCIRYLTLHFFLSYIYNQSIPYVRVSITISCSKSWSITTMKVIRYSTERMPDNLRLVLITHRVLWRCNNIEKKAWQSRQTRYVRLCVQIYIESESMSSFFVWVAEARNRRILDEK